jgi:cytochrome c
MAGKRARPKVTLIATATKNSGIVWSEASFKEYLEDPQAKMPGTKMIFSDKNEKEVTDLWAYLKQFGVDGKKKAQ